MNKNQRDKKYFRPLTHTEYIKKRRENRKWGNPIEKRIYTSNNRIAVKKEYIIDKKSCYKYVDEKYLIEDETNSQREYFLFASGLLSFMLIGLFIDFKDHSISDFILYGLHLVVVLFLFIYGFFHPSYIYIYNRFDGTVSLPLMWGMGSWTIPYKKLIYIESMSRLGATNLAIVHPKPWAVNRGQGTVDGGISMHAWFMDKNRPLPPGSAYDKFRELDYQRRKAEGFQEPLYPSDFLIMEETKEHEKEKKEFKYVTLDTFERETESEWYDPKKHTTWYAVPWDELTEESREDIAYQVIRFEFEDGRIIYSRSSEEGLIPKPPAHEKFALKVIEGAGLNEI